MKNKSFKLRIRVTALILAVTLVFTACGRQSEPENSETSETSAETQASETTTKAETEPEIIIPEEIPYTPYVPTDYETRDITAWELVGEIIVGWNLGNTFDAPGGETSWGNPETTFTMISKVADEGFDAVRIPVTWGRHLGDSPDFTIDGEFLDRVEEAVGYVLSTGMYCIINTHHDHWIYPAEDVEEDVTAQLTAVWSQIAERFADYNEKLIFEVMNEPRLYDTPNEWNGGTAEARNVINRLNAAFIELIRSSGGNNGLRHLMIPTYAASSEGIAVNAVSDAFDEITKGDDKVIVSIHAYTPTNFAQDPLGTDRWLAVRQEEEINWMFGRLKEGLIDKDIPVIMGETGVVNKDNLPARVEWTKYYFSKSKELGIPALWWDNGIFEKRSETSETFGFLDRRRAEFVFPEILEAIMAD